MNKEYKDMLNELHFSSEQKEQMIDRLMQQAAQPMPAYKPRRSMKRTVAAVLAAAAVLSMGAGAAYVGWASDAFKAAFGTAQTEIIDKIGYPVDASASDAGFTITADAVMGDKYNINIVYTITAQDGRVLDADNMLCQETLDFNQSGMGGSSWFVDDVPGDNQVQYIMQCSVDDEKGIRQGTATAHFTSIKVWDDASEQATVLAEGNWKLRFDLRYDDIGTELLSEPIAVETQAGTAMIQSVNISPLGFRIAAEYPTVNEQTQKEIDSFEQPESGKWPGDTPYDKLTAFSIVLNLKDGSTLDLGKWMGSSCNIYTRKIVLRDTFRDEVIPLDQMESITIQDVTLPIQ